MNLSSMSAAGAAPAEGSMLGSPLRLGEIESAEAFVRSLLDERLRSWCAYLNPGEYEDALSYLVAELWLLWKRYDPEKGSNSFSTYAYRILWRRVASWYRQRFTDTRYHEKPTLVSLDDRDVEPADEYRQEYARINDRALTPEGKRAFEKLARPMVEEDLSLEQLAQRFGYSRRWVSRELERLRAELAPMIQ